MQKHVSEFADAKSLRKLSIDNAFPSHHWETGTNTPQLRVGIDPKKREADGRFGSVHPLSIFVTKLLSISEFCTSRISWKRDDIADICHTGDELDDTLQAQPESTVRNTTEAAEV